MVNSQCMTATRAFAACWPTLSPGEFRYPHADREHANGYAHERVPV